MGTGVIWFGIVATVLIEVGLVTPPVGINLYVIMSVSNCSLQEVVKGVLPFFLILLLSVALLTVFLMVATWLPGVLFG